MLREKNYTTYKLLALFVALMPLNSGDIPFSLYPFLFLLNKYGVGEASFY